MKVPIIATVLLLSRPAFAHFFPSDSGPAAGFLHPLLGADHLLAMFSVGALSVNLNRRALWLLPAVFVFGMIIGGTLGIARVPMPLDAAGIAFSVFALGACLAFGYRVPKPLAYALVCLFGLWHGHAHGLEAPVGDRNLLLYVVGFLTTTIGLHLMGVLSGLITQEYKSGRRLTQIFGGAMTLAGAVFMGTP